MDYREAVDYLMSFTDMERGVQRSSSPTMSLASMRSLLSRLNDPHLGRRTIHVTGSKGKGSTAAMIEGMLRRDANSTALFTSPHLHAFTERIAIDGSPISPAELAAALEAIQPAVEQERESVHGNVSTFGVLTALFFWLARAQVPHVDWQVVEVGLGGTFDTTNVFTAPDVVVITPISLEHTAILGSTTAEIAADKAGLVKPGATCVLAAQRSPEVAEVVRARCAEVGAELVEVAQRYTATPGEHFPFGQAFTLHGPAGSDRMRTTLLGRHQMENAMTAIAVADALRDRGVPLARSAAIDGIAHTRVPGRMEIMARSPLIVGDGAHNGESAARLAEALREYLEWQRCVLVLGTMADKDLDAIVAALAPLAGQIVCTGFRSPRARDPHEMAQSLSALERPVAAAATVADAISQARAAAGPEDLICIAGSLYVVAEAREALLGESVLPD